MEKKPRTTKAKLPEESNRQIRAAISNLLSIWREFAFVESFLSEDDPSNTVIFQSPELTKKYLDIDRDKIERIENSFNASLETIKEVNVVLFYKLENSVVNFRHVLDELYFPITQDREISQETKNEFCLPLLKESLKDLQESIFNAAAFLPAAEEKEIKDLIPAHRKKLLENANSLAPEFIVSFVNSALPFGGFIKAESLRAVVKNETVVWLIGKLAKAGLFRLVFQNRMAEPIKLLSAVRDRNNEKLQIIEQKFVEDKLIDRISISEEEENYYIIGNAAFRDTLLLMVESIFGVVPEPFRLEVEKFYTGETSIRAMLEQEKAKSEIDTLLL